MQILDSIKRGRFCRFFTVSAVVTYTGCILAPPLDPLPPEENFPPSILDRDPDTPVLVVQNSDDISFAVQAGDPNDERELNYAWVGDESGLLKNGAAGRTASEELHRGVFFTYETIDLSLNPCSSALRGLERETLWLYISDRDLNVTAADPVEVDTSDEGFIDVWSWVLTIRPEACL